MLKKEFILFLLILLFIFIILIHLFKQKCSNQSIKFLNAIKQQKQGVNIIRNEKNITDYELTILNIQRQFNETWKEYLIDNEPIKLISGDAEIKYFLKFNNPNIECNVITMGVGQSVDAEMELKKNYPQCSFLSLDPDSEINADLVENKLKGTFIQGAIGAEDSYSAQMSANMNKNGQPAIGFFDFFLYYNSKPVIDLLLLDVEGAEFAIFQLLTEQYNQLPVIICQINVEVHQHSYSNIFLKQRFLRNLDTFFRHSKYAMLKNDIFRRPTEIFHRMFFVNYVDNICVKKFFC